MRGDSGSAADHTRRPQSDGHALLCRWIALVLTGGASIWIFLLAPFPMYAWSTLSFIYLVPAVLGLIATAVGRQPRLGPWAYWLGAALLYMAINTALNPSLFATWKFTGIFLFVFMLGVPITFALTQAGMSARVLCGMCIFLSLVGILQSRGIDLKAGIANVTDLDPLQIQLTNHVRLEGNQKIYEAWLLFLTWITLAALRPATQIHRLVAAAVFTLSGIAIATGYSLSSKITFVCSIGVFFAVVTIPRFARGFTLTVFAVLFLGAPVWAKALWLWSTSHINQDIRGELYKTLHLVKRFGHWEYWAEMVSRQPWTGHGINAYLELPRMWFDELFGTRGPYLTVWRFYNVRTESPHGFPLQVWSDLGVFGVIIVMGFVASLVVNSFPERTRDIGASARSTLLVAALMVVCLTGNVVWNPHNLIVLMLAAGLAAGTLRAGRSPARALPGLTMRREKILILSVLLLGVLVVAGSNAWMRLADSRYTPKNTQLDLERGVLRHRGKGIALDKRVHGGIDRIVRHDEYTVTVHGWALGPAAPDASLQVLIFQDATLLGVARTGRPRPNLQRTSNLPNLDLLFSGFELRVTRPVDSNPQSALHAVFLSPSGSASIPQLRPTGLSAAPGGEGEIVLTWNDPSDGLITAYQFRVRQDRYETDWRPWRDIPGSGAGTVTYTIVNLTPRNEYSVQVRAGRDGTWNIWSEPSTLVRATTGAEQH